MKAATKLSSFRRRHFQMHFLWMKMYEFRLRFHWSLFLTHWGRVTHICVDKLTIIDSDNGLSPGRRQAIISINTGVLLIGPLGTNLSEILIEIYAFSFTKMHLKTSSGKWPPSCLGFNVLRSEFTTFQSLSEPMMLIHWHICANWPQWVNSRHDISYSSTSFCGHIGADSNGWFLGG